MQATIVFGIISIAEAIFSRVLVLGWLIWLFGVVLWIVLMVKAYQGTKYKLPFAGNLAEKWVK
jgi:uncharacterized membrane protein